MAVFQWRVEIFAPMSGSVAKIFIKAAGPWMVRPLAAVVPFTESARGIASDLERIRDDNLVAITRALNSWLIM